MDIISSVHFPRDSPPKLYCSYFS